MAAQDRTKRRALHDKGGTSKYTYPVKDGKIRQLSFEMDAASHHYLSFIPAAYRKRMDRNEGHCLERMGQDR